MEAKMISAGWGYSPTQGPGGWMWLLLLRTSIGSVCRFKENSKGLQQAEPVSLQIVFHGWVNSLPLSTAFRINPCFPLMDDSDSWVTRTGWSVAWSEISSRRLGFETLQCKCFLSRLPSFLCQGELPAQRSARWQHKAINPVTVEHSFDCAGVSTPSLLPPFSPEQTRDTSPPPSFWKPLAQKQQDSKEATGWERAEGLFTAGMTFCGVSCRVDQLRRSGGSYDHHPKPHSRLTLPSSCFVQ